jgi:hypothetical protein
MAWLFSIFRSSIWSRNQTWVRVGLLGCVLLAGLGGLLSIFQSARDEAADHSSSERRKREQKSQPTSGGDNSKVLVGQNVFLEVTPTGRRVLISAEVCLREGSLELLLTRKRTKDHEAILMADIDARKVHEALLLAGAVNGSPVRFDPKYRPASGTPIVINLIYQKNGQRVVVPARSWVRKGHSNQELESDWVFAGSELLENPDSLDSQVSKNYLANAGDVVCIANFETALLDVPIVSSKAYTDLGYEAWTERIPEVGTKVVVALEPVIKRKK